jgi:adenylate cyclase
VLLPFVICHLTAHVFLLVSLDRARGLLFGVALLVPTVALSGYVTAGNQILRAGSNPDQVKLIFKRSDLTDQKRADIARIARLGSAGYVVLTPLPFVGRYVRGWLYRRRRPAMLSHSSGQILPVLPGATVLETLRGHGIPHASFAVEEAAAPPAEFW